MKDIIAFIGRAGSGKDYQCSLLEKKGYKRLAFADTLREVASQIARIDYNDLINNYTEFKEKEIFPNYTGRQLLENIGSAIRKVDKHFWANGLTQKIIQSKEDLICISDMRYLNEYMIIKDLCESLNYNLTVYFCDYHSNRYQKYNNHESAHLSNYFAENGYKDLSILTMEDFLKYKKFVDKQKEE